MNARVWAIDENAVLAATWLCDADTVRAPLDCAELLGTCWQWYVKQPPRTPHNWPADKPFLPPSLDLEDEWVRFIMRCDSNYRWVADYAVETCNQYHARFGKRPLYAATVGVLSKPPYALQKGALTDFPYPVDVYRATYAARADLTHWRHSNQPRWLTDYRR